MKKQTKVLLAAALFTLGASFSSMAALKNGTWVLNEDGWQYADKEGEYVEEEWCYSYGVEYWIDDEGYLGSSQWVTDSEDRTYYVQSDGSKTVSAWKYLYAEDEEDDEDAEEAWFYFDAKGRMVKNKFRYQIGDYYYSFDDEGKMLTGWVDVTDSEDADGNTVYVLEELGSAENAVDPSDVAYHDEETGALVRYSWINVFPWTEDEDDMYEGDDEVYYYTNSYGKPYTNQIKKIDGFYYALDENGQMLDEWVIETVDGDVKAVSDLEDIEEAAALYYCDEDYGYAKTNSWRSLDNIDDDTFWFYFDKLGKAFYATDSDATELSEGQRLVFVNGETGEVSYDDDFHTNGEDKFIVETKKIDGTYYYFNQYGEMMDGLVNIDGKLMYLDEGARATGKVTLTDENENDYTFCFADETNSSEGYEKYVAVNGNMDGYLYKNGQLVKSEDSDVYLEVEITNGEETAKFVVDYRGKIMHKDGKEYEGAGTYNFSTTNEGWNEDCVVE